MAKTDVFGRSDGGVGGAYRAGLAKMNLGSGFDKLLVQNVQLNYQRQISNFYDLRSDLMYYNEGRCSGSGSISNIVGPKGSDAAVYNMLSDVCKPASLTFDLTGGSCANVKNAARTAEGAVLASISASIAAQDMVMQEGMQIMFARFLVG